MNDAPGGKAPQPFGSLEGGNLRRVHNDLGRPGQLQQVAGGEIGEDQASLGIDQKVTERVEEQIAGEIGNGGELIRRQRSLGAG